MGREGKSKDSGDKRKQQDEKEKHGREHKRHKHKHGNGEGDDHHRKHKDRKKEKHRERDSKLMIVDDDTKQSLWQEKDITMDGERVRIWSLLFFCRQSSYQNTSHRSLRLTFQQLKV